MDQEKQALRMRVAQTLIRLGVPMKLRGYEFLREAILLAYADPELPIKTVYTKTAARFGVSSDAVIRGCRSAIARAFERGCPTQFEGCMNVSCTDSDRFILLTVQKLREGAW